MNDHIKKEVNKLDIPKSLNESSRAGIFRAEKEMQSDRKKYKLNSVRVIIGLLILIGAFNVFQDFFSLMGMGPKTINDIAYVPNIETLSASSSFIIKGTVLGDAEPTNLNRNLEDPSKEGSKITPGIYHSVSIDEILTGDMDGKDHDEIKVAVTGGIYKGVVSKVQANLEAGESYLFFLISSSRGYPYFFGAGEPYVFKVEDDHINAVSNMDYKEIFEDDNISVESFYNKIN